MAFSHRVRQLFARRDLPRASAQALPETFDVTEHLTEIDLSALEVIRSAPAWLTRAERLFLFTFVFGLRPARYVEIGTLQGGSALIVNAAMQAAGTTGTIVCLDPQPHIALEHWQQLEKRTTLVRGYSPEALPRARELAGGLFDLVFIDGDHTGRGVYRDANAVLPFVAPDAYVLFHDSFFPEVAAALDQLALEHAHDLVDCGCVTREATSQSGADSARVLWGGLRLMRHRASH